MPAPEQKTINISEAMRGPTAVTEGISLQGDVFGFPTTVRRGGVGLLPWRLFYHDDCIRAFGKHDAEEKKKSCPTKHTEGKRRALHAWQRPEHERSTSRRPGQGLAETPSITHTLPFGLHTETSPVDSPVENRRNGSPVANLSLQICAFGKV